jgi:photosystem II stability/assembly factor-like uncharacterized protein
LRALAVAAALVIQRQPALSFADARHGWASGRGGIVATANGGRTWRLQTRAGAVSLGSVDATHAWALTRPGSLLRTTDGRTWRRVPGPRLAEVDFVSRRRGFALRTDGALLRSADGGTTWTHVAAPGRVQALCFEDARHGWLARGGTVWRTRNGAGSWRRTRLLGHRQELLVPALWCRGSHAWVTFFGGAAAGSGGYAVFRLEAARARAVFAQFLLPRVRRIDAYGGIVAVLPDGRAVVEGWCPACGRGSVSLVRPGGARTTLRGRQPGPLAFTDTRHGYLVSQLFGARVGTILRTLDGGRTWRRVYASRRLVAA